jgi:hypothetical protein
MYKYKYLKYKTKYNILKTLLGGSIELANFDIDEVEQKFKQLNTEEIKNLGQHNCGILFYETYAIKCLRIVTEIPASESEKELALFGKINEELKGLFPTLYKWPNNKVYHYIEVDENKYAKCYIMEKLEGDLTSFILEESYKQGNLDEKEYKFYYERLPNTNGDFIWPTKDSYDNQTKFGEIKKQISPHIKKLVESLNDKVINLHHNFIKKGWKYGDLKFDNIGYKLNNGDIKLYFIDKESGLFELDDSDFTNYLELYSLGTPLLDYGILGQYNIINIFNIKEQPILKFEEEHLRTRLTSLNIQVGELESIWNFLQCKVPGRDDFFVIQLCSGGYYRLVTFDKESRHISNSAYDNDVKIDELFLGVDDLLKKIHEIYILK